MKKKRNTASMAIFKMLAISLLLHFSDAYGAANDDSINYQRKYFQDPDRSLIRVVTIPDGTSSSIQRFDRLEQVDNKWNWKLLFQTKLFESSRSHILTVDPIHFIHSTNRGFLISYSSGDYILNNEIPEPSSKYILHVDEKGQIQGRLELPRYKRVITGLEADGTLDNLGQTEVADLERDVNRRLFAVIRELNANAGLSSSLDQIIKTTQLEYKIDRLSGKLVATEIPQSNHLVPYNHSGLPKDSPLVTANSLVLQAPFGPGILFRNWNYSNGSGDSALTIVTDSEMNSKKISPVALRAWFSEILNTSTAAVSTISNTIVYGVFRDHSYNVYELKVGIGFNQRMNGQVLYYDPKVHVLDRIVGGAAISKIEGLFGLSNGDIFWDRGDKRIEESPTIFTASDILKLKDK